MPIKFKFSRVLNFNLKRKNEIHDLFELLIKNLFIN